MSAQKKVGFYTLGCKLNFSETSTIARSFQSEGFDRVNFAEKADIYVINTCSVTDNADKRFKTIVKSALKQNEHAFLIAIGCYAQLNPEELAAVGLTPEEIQPIRDAMSSHSTDAIEKASKLVTDDMVDQFTIAGNPEECIETIAKYYKAGIDRITLDIPYNPALYPEESIKLAKQKILPYFKEQRG